MLHAPGCSWRSDARSFRACGPFAPISPTVAYATRPASTSNRRAFPPTRQWRSVRHPAPPVAAGLRTPSCGKPSACSPPTPAQAGKAACLDRSQPGRRLPELVGSLERPDGFVRMIASAPMEGRVSPPSTWASRGHGSPRRDHRIRLGGGSCRGEDHDASLRTFVRSFQP
jgi:hypothetical protein